MDRISIFNYEAYYLDYLEGNLNEEDSAMLLAFLEEYPECQVDGDELPLLSMEDTPSYKYKEDLKEVDSKEKITLANYNHFLVESTEGIISLEKKAELAAFLTENDLAQEEKLAGAVYFSPDESVVFGDKAGLKQKETLVLWPYISTAAAACIIVLMLLWNSDPSKPVTPNGGQVAEENVDKPNGFKPVSVQENTMIANEVPSSSNTNVPSNNKFETNSGVVNSMENQTVDKIDRSPTRPIITHLDEKQIASITKQTYVDQPNNTKPSPEMDYASLHFADMDNPIEPITKILSEKTNTALDFRREKATKKKAGGFFVKIGKFELSHKKHK